MAEWSTIIAAVGLSLGGERDQGRHDLDACWADTTDADHAQRCVLAHYLADLQPDLADEVAYDERALAAFAHLSGPDLAAIGIPDTAGMAPSLHLNLGDGYLRQGRLDEARAQLQAGLSAQDALADDGYGALVRRGLTGLQARLDAARAGSADDGVAPRATTATMSDRPRALLAVGAGRYARRPMFCWR